jgi:hypothetical protein
VDPPVLKLVDPWWTRVEVAGDQRLDPERALRPQLRGRASAADRRSLHAASRSRRLAPLLLACGLVIGGGLLVTFLANVPLNDELAAVDPDAGRDVLARARADYEDPWNTWNAVRTITSTAALTCLAWALRPPASRPPTAE